MDGKNLQLFVCRKCDKRWRISGDMLLEKLIQWYNEKDLIGWPKTVFTICTSCQKRNKYFKTYNY